MNRVIFTPEVRLYYENLIPILYERGYFSFADSAQKYVQELVDDIIKNLTIKRHKPAPTYFDRYGNDMEYASFKKSKQTTWYVFFRVYVVGREVVYQVRYIGNNHTIAQYL